MRLTRGEAIQDIREMLLTLVDDEHSICDVAARLRIGCRGLDQWSTDELRRRFPWIAEEHPDAAREQLEELAQRWLLSRQMPSHGLLPCDLFARAKGPCAGWEEFYEADLARTYLELFGVEVEVVPDSLSPGPEEPSLR
jgi:hypothetical protein